VEKLDIQEKFSQFLREFYYNELVTAVSEGRKSINVDFSVLEKFNSELADYTLENPEEIFQIAEDSLKQIDLPSELKLRVRFFNLPEIREIRIRNLRAEHIGKLIVVDGMVRRASEVRPEVSEAIFQCPQCGEKMTVIQSGTMLNPPFQCDRCDNTKNFKLVEQKLYDARWLAIEEPFEITTGERPSEIKVFLKEDLTSPKMRNKTDPGNRIKVTGVLKQLPRRIKGTLSRQMEIFIDANYLHTVEVEWEELDISNTDEKRILEISKDPQIYDKLIASIVPSIYGHEEIKEAIVLQLFGGVPHVQKDKSRVRGDIHILLVGDPSCLVADERVVMADGTIMKIGDMGKEHLQEIDFKVHTGMEGKVGRTNRFHVYRKQPIIEIVTETGKSIKGTFNQPVLIVKNGKRSWKRLDEMNIGDKVQVIPRIKCNKKTLVMTNWKEYPDYHKSCHIKIPKFVDEDLAGLFGYIIAGGWVQKSRLGFVVNKDEMDIFPILENILKKSFDVSVKTLEHKKASPNVKYYQVEQNYITKLLSFLNEKRVPKYIFQSPNSVVASFLRWIYEGDGSVFSNGRERTSVNLKSNNVELLRDVQILLLRFGIHSRISWKNKSKNLKKEQTIASKPSCSLIISRSESIIKFGQNIGFVSKKKKDKLLKMVEYARNHVHRIHKNWTEKIVKINKLPVQDVFDIEVPKYNRFVANGIVVHNTAKSVLMKTVSGLIPRGRYVSGKGVSVDYDDPVIYMENGRIKTELIGKVIDKFYEQDEYGFAPAPNILVPAFGKNWKIKWSPVKYVYRHKTDEKLIKIRLRSGREIKITADHSVFTMKDGNIIAKKGNEILKGDFILVPNKIPKSTSPIRQINLAEEFKKIPKEELKRIQVCQGFLKSKHSTHKIPSIIKIDDKFMRLIGYYIADGWLHETKDDSCKIEFSIDTSDRKTINDIKNIVKTVFGITVSEKKRSNSCVLSINDKITFLIFKYVLGVESLPENKKIPQLIFNVAPERQKEFVKGLIIGNYGVTVSKKLVSDLLYLFLLNNTNGSFSIRKKEGIQEIPDGHNSFVNREIFELKSPKIKSILSNMFSNSNLHSRVPLKFVKQFWLNHGKSDYKVSNSGMELLFSKNRSKIYEILLLLKDWKDAKELSKLIKKNVRSTKEYLNDLVNKGLIEKRKFGKIQYKTGKFGESFIKSMNFIKKCRQSDFGFEEVIKISREKPKGKYVYDFSVEGKENFIAGFGGILCHNTAAGLTATVVRDEEFLGGWVLEAGALVMCNRSLCAIDEFEKVDKADQVALHEGMEQQSISIAKANIVATLPARTSVLAGGNPKLGRFDPYVPIKEQIEVPETLLSRFDLKFALRDIPNPQVDELVAEHILKTRHFNEDTISAPFDDDFLKKFVAYARKNSHPKLSREAGQELKNFFVSLREKVTHEEAPVPITLRQYESLIRLAEASAKIQLRDTVTREDAIRAINLMKASLREFGFDPETGKIDIDRVEGHTTASERGKIRTMLEVIDELISTLGKNLPKEEILKAAKSHGIKEFDIEKMLIELKKNGTLFEPQPGVYQKM